MPVLAGRIEKEHELSAAQIRAALAGKLLPEISKDEPVCCRVFRVGGELQYRDDRYAVYRGVVRTMTPQQP